MDTKGLPPGEEAIELFPPGSASKAERLAVPSLTRIGYLRRARMPISKPRPKAMPIV